MDERLLYIPIDFNKKNLHIIPENLGFFNFFCSIINPRRKILNEKEKTQNITKKKKNLNPIKNAKDPKQ